MEGTTQIQIEVGRCFEKIVPNSAERNKNRRKAVDFCGKAGLFEISHVCGLPKRKERNINKHLSK
jgi:hypothetical protein